MNHMVLQSKAISGQLLQEIGEMAADRRKGKKPVVSCQECHRRKQKCDRLQPCANCIKRDKKHLCVYTCMEEEALFDPRAGPAALAAQTPSSIVGSQVAESSSTPLTTVDGGMQSISACLGYSEHSKTGTLRLIHMAGDAPAREQHRHDDSSDTHAAERYIGIIRQLPSQKYIEVLVQLFFSDLEWYYGVIDEDVFRQYMRAWNSVPYTTLRRGPFHLPPDTRVFPALLFQMLAHALLFLPTKFALSLADIKYAPAMTFADLATEYSDAGQAVVSILRKEDGATMAKVQAGLLRASFLKSTASVVHAWHMIGATIRDGQELGLACVLDNHVDSMDLETLKEAEMRAKLWIMLHLWDGHMGVVLGRPMLTRLKSSDWISLFSAIDKRREQLQSQTTVLPGSAADTLTPFSIFIFGYGVAYRYLQDIESLSKTISTEDLDKERVLERVEHMDTAIADGLRNMPAWAQDDLTFIMSHPWLSAARETLLTEVHFVVLAVHRPFIFSSPRSRDRARQAALHILASQNRFFGMSEPREYLPFNLIFATFDAMVLLATLYILFPGERQDQQALGEVFSSMEWGLVRLEAIKTGGRNKMAVCAFNVVQALYAKMQGTRKQQQGDGSDGFNSFTSGDSAATFGPEGLLTYESDHVLREDHISAIPPSSEDWKDLQGLGDLVGLPFELFSPEIAASNIANMPPPHPLHNLIVQAGFGEGTSWSADDDALF